MSRERNRTYIDNKKIGSTGRTAGEVGGVRRSPGRWKSDQEPATTAQRSYLATLAREAREEVPEELSKAEAAKQIEKLQRKTGRRPLH